MPQDGPSFEVFLNTPELAALGPGPRGTRQSIPVLERALQKVFSTTHHTDEQHKLIRALVLLWHDHLDIAHTLAQEMDTPDGSLIHAIIHRREPDYGNAKYWFHRVRHHPSFADIGSRVADLPSSGAECLLLDRCAPDGVWDPVAFIDCCQAEASSSSGHEAFLQKMQRTEFSALLNYFSASR